MADDEQPTVAENRESSIRWQGRTIEQFGYALNLILGLSVAAIGFEVSLLLSEGFEKTGWQSSLFVVSMLSLLLSFVVGLWCIVNRLQDFRETTKTARKREDGSSALELQPLRTLARTLGKRTWVLFWWQIFTFGAGILLLVWAVGMQIARVVIG